MTKVFVVRVDDLEIAGETSFELFSSRESALKSAAHYLNDETEFARKRRCPGQDETCPVPCSKCIRLNSLSSLLQQEKIEEAMERYNAMFDNKSVKLYEQKVLP